MYDEDGHPIGHSMNHYSPGAVCAWLFDTVCGIRIIGKNCFLVRPIPGGTFDSRKSRVSQSVRADRFRLGKRKRRDRLSCHDPIQLPCPDRTSGWHCL